LLNVGTLPLDADQIGAFQVTAGRVT
jgi:hypothetical protein